MKILYISQYFYPELGATSYRAASIIRAMRDRGHQVSMICEMPNHPKGIIFEDYRGKFVCKSSYEGIPVMHLPVIASPQKNFLTRITMYLSFSISACIYLLFARPKYDLIYVSSPPLFTALCGLLSKAIFPRRKLVFEVRDLWPDSAIQLGELGNPILRKASLNLELMAYLKADLVVGVTAYIKDQIHKKGISDSKIVVNRNGVGDVILEAYEQQNPLRDGKNFTAIFTGNMGVVQGLDTILHCASLMREDPISFHFIGDGPSKQSLIQLKEELQLSNVEFIPQMSQEDLGKVMANVDFGLVELKDLPISKGALPTKIFDYMTFRLPTIAAMKGEAADIIREAEAGIVIPLQDPPAMREALKRLMDDDDLRKRMGDKAREYVLQNFCRRDLADRIVTELENRFCSGMDQSKK